MTAANLTPAEARKLGLGGVTGQPSGSPAAGPTKRKQRRTAGGLYHTRCCFDGCDATFDTIVAEDKHLAFNPTHTRYELELGPAPKGSR
jgi:hypothetical protein